ncbi:MAG: Ger(x)C family spore germination protein [Cohnella sp.]|nr:Ger(x)C family spore germination protein [Cohnella sp.]
MGELQLNQLAIVTAVGIENGHKPGTVRISAQIIRPSDARGQTGAPSGGTGQPIYSALAEGETIFDAIRNLGRFVSRRVYWAHNFLIVIREDYARNGIEGLVDFFTRNHELRMTTRVAVTSDSPAEMISTITGLEVVPGQAVDNLFRDNDIAGQAPSTNMMNLEEAFLSRSSEPVLARLSLVSRGISNKKPQEHGSLKQVELIGAAAFKGDKMMGWLSPEETRGLLFFTEKLDSGIEVVDCPNDGNKLSLEFRDARLKVTPSYRNEQPGFRISLRTKADVTESGCGTDIGKIRLDIERALEDQLKGNIEALLNKAQRQYHSDIVKLADVFRNKFPEEWRKVGSQWSSAFSEAQIEIVVKANVKSVVLKSVGSVK